MYVLHELVNFDCFGVCVEESGAAQCTPFGTEVRQAFQAKAETAHRKKIDGECAVVAFWG